jgi:Uma2 family endonuclease
MGTKGLMTVAGFSQMQTAETEDYELVEGEPIPLSSGTPRHSIISADTVRRPDVSVFFGDRLREIDMNTIPVPFAPDIAVEVLSSSESAVDVHRKVRDYLSAGSQEVWILDHINIEVFVHTPSGIRLLGAQDVLESQLLPGFAAPVHEFFAAE